MVAWQECIRAAQALPAVKRAEAVRAISLEIYAALEARQITRAEYAALVRLVSGHGVFDPQPR